VGATARGGTDHHNRAGTEGNGLNKDDGVVDSAEEAESNKASAGSKSEEMEERLAEIIAS
jgi:hypothetical protein